MTQILKADTSVKVVIGPFVDVGDGFTPETGVTLTGGGDNADEAELLKHDNATTVDISANTWAALTGVDGYYHLTLTAGNLDTEGMLDIIIQNDSVHLPVRKSFMVVSANVYDSLYAASGTDTLDVQVTGMGANTVTAAAIAASALDGKGDWNIGKTGYALSAAGVDAIWDETMTAHVTADSAAVALKDVLADTNELQTDDVPGLIAALNDITAASVMTTQMTEAYAADAVAPTPAEMLFMIWSFLHDTGYSGTTKTSRKLDNTTAMTHTLDDATNPTDITRAT